MVGKVTENNNNNSNNNNNNNNNNNSNINNNNNNKKNHQLNFQTVRKKISQSKTSNGAFLRKHLKAKSR